MLEIARSRSPEGSALRSLVESAQHPRLALSREISGGHNLLSFARSRSGLTFSGSTGVLTEDRRPDPVRTRSHHSRFPPSSSEHQLSRARSVGVKPSRYAKRRDRTTTEGVTPCVAPLTPCVAPHVTPMCIHRVHSSGSDLRLAPEPARIGSAHGLADFQGTLTGAFSSGAADDQAGRTKV